MVAKGDVHHEQNSPVHEKRTDGPQAAEAFVQQRQGREKFEGERSHSEQAEESQPIVKHVGHWVGRHTEQFLAQGVHSHLAAQGLAGHPAQPERPGQFRHGAHEVRGACHRAHQFDGPAILPPRFARGHLVRLAPVAQQRVERILIRRARHCQHEHVQGEQVVGMVNHGPRIAETEQPQQQYGEKGGAEAVPQSERETQSADDHAAVYPVEQFQAGRSAEHNANRREQFRIRAHDLDEVILRCSRVPEREQPDQDAQHRQPGGRRGFKPEITQDLAYRFHSAILSTGQEALICSETGACLPWK